MYTGLVHLHNLLRWVIVITLVWSLWNAFKGKNGKETLFMMISSHVMLLIGLIQWFGGDWGLKQIKSLGMGEAMKNMDHDKMKEHMKSMGHDKMGEGMKHMDHDKMGDDMKNSDTKPKQ